MIPEIAELSRHFLEKYNRTYVRDFLKTANLNNRFSIVVGKRGVGKSTAMIQYLSSAGTDAHSDILYVQSDHFIVNRYNLYTIAEEFTKSGGKLICFDEIHKYPSWSAELKSIYDTFTELKILATGSSVLEISRGTHDLSRRALVLKMPGMSFKEFIELNLSIEIKSSSFKEIIKEHPVIASEIIMAVEKTGHKILPLFEQFLRHGHYPFFLESGEEMLFHTLLEQNIHTVVEVDISCVYPNLDSGQIRKIKMLLSFIAGSVPFMPDYNAIKQAVDVADNRTIKTYMNYLENAGTLMLFPKEGRKFDSLRKPEKIYLGDTNQLFALRGRTGANTGTVRETFFAQSFHGHAEIQIPKKGDFLINGKWLFEVGGKNKTFKQIAGRENAFLAVDGIERGYENKIPLWLFGLLKY